MKIDLRHGKPAGQIELKAGNIVLYRNSNIEFILAWAGKNLKLSEQDLTDMRKDFEDAT